MNASAGRPSCVARSPSDRGAPSSPRHRHWRIGWSLRGASPNAVSVVGMIAACLAGGAFALTREWPAGARVWWLLGAALVQTRLMANLLDGMVAIGRGVASATGELYNEVPDRVSDSAILAGPRRGQAAASPWGSALRWRRWPPPISAPSAKVSGNPATSPARWPSSSAWRSSPALAVACAALPVGLGPGLAADRVVGHHRLWRCSRPCADWRMSRGDADVTIDVCPPGHQGASSSPRCMVLAAGGGHYRHPLAGPGVPLLP